MPCYSSISQTQITDLQRLIDALKALNISVLNSSELSVTTSSGYFTRQAKDKAFVFNGTKAALSPIGKKYAELTARSWAAKRGMTVLKSEQKQLVFIKR